MSNIGEPIRIVEIPEPVPIQRPQPAEEPIPLPKEWPRKPAEVPQEVEVEDA